MLQVTNVGLRFGDKELYKDVNLKFTKGNCYGIIGANGAGKTTFLKILAGDIEPNTGSVSITEKERMSVLRQDHFKYDEETVLDVVIMGHERLYQIMQEKDALYMKPDFSEEDGIKAAELEGEFAELDGWDAETNAEKILMGLGIDKELHYKQMKELEGGEKVKVLLAQALFGNPGILILDEPTNHLDIDSKEVLEEALSSYTGTIFTISHDRYFLNTVVDKVLVLDENGITEYLGNYDYYIEKKKQVQEMNTVEVVEEKTKTQLKEEKRKEREQREAEKKNRVKRQNIEKEIEETEAKIEEMDVLLCQEEVYSNPEKSKDVSLQKASLEEKLSALYEEWESLM